MSQELKKKLPNIPAVVTNVVESQPPPKKWENLIEDTDIIQKSVKKREATKSREKARPIIKRTPKITSPAVKSPQKPQISPGKDKEEKEEEVQPWVNLAEAEDHPHQQLIQRSPQVVLRGRTPLISPPQKKFGLRSPEYDQSPVKTSNVVLPGLFKPLRRLEKQW